jgi:thiol-activated cytolysin
MKAKTTLQSFLTSTKSIHLMAIIFTGAVITLLPGSTLADPPAGDSPASSRTAAVVNPQIDAYITGMKYDPRQILAEQEGDTVIPATPLPDEVQDDGQAIVICKKVKHHLSGNIDDQIILNPTHGVIWPGALVIVDQDLVRGVPAPVSLRRAPMSLSVDLPGIGKHGVFRVDNPGPGPVQAAIDEALDYWNNNKYREGYVSESRSQYSATVAYSAEQLAAALGVSYHNFANSIAAQFKITTSRESKVAVALYKQVFYTVSFDPPLHPGAVFDSSVTLDEVRNAITAETPAAYVSSVDYGRILMLRIEASADTLDADLEAAAKYGAVKAKVSADYKKVLKNSKLTLYTIGGNAAVNAEAVNATSLEDLNAVIQGRNALYSKSNPGQPIAYTVRFLKNSRLAKMGYSTDYTEVTYERYPYGVIGLKHQGAYVAKFYVNWKEGDEAKSWSSGKVTSGWHSDPVIKLKGNAHDIHIQLQSSTGISWVKRGIDLTGPPPPGTWFVATGTAYYPSLTRQK